MAAITADMKNTVIVRRLEAPHGQSSFREFRPLSAAMTAEAGKK